MILLTAELTETANSVGNIINTWGFPMFAMIVLALVLFAAIKYGVKRIEAYEQKSEKRTDKLEIELAKSHDALADIARQQQQTIAENTAIISKATEQLGRSSEVIDKALDNQERLMQHLEQFSAQDSQLMAMMQTLVDKLDN